ncbi:MAG: hypothetical protein GMKNLPBB_00860 [Myxococcota bacterium]|nr:hypothetical protein [Myxococcota bacterium]
MDARTYLEQETTAAERSFRVALIAFAIVAIVILIYFAWMKSMIKEAIQPENLAVTVVGAVRGNLPEVRKNVQEEFSEALPGMIQQFADSLLQQGIPMVRTMGVDMFKDFSGELIKFSSNAANQVFESVLKSDSNNLRKQLKTNPAAIELAIANEMGSAMKTALQSDAGAGLSKSLVALKNINAKLQAMAKKQGGTKQEELGRKLISSWWSYLQTTAAPAVYDEKDTAAKKGGKPAAKPAEKKPDGK